MESTDEARENKTGNSDPEWYFNDLHKRFNRYVVQSCRQALRTLGRSSLADDVASRVWILVWDNVSAGTRPDNDDGVRKWLNAFIYNVAREETLKARRKLGEAMPEKADQPILPDVPGSATDYRPSDYRSWETRNLEWALNRLSERERSCVREFYFNSKSCAQIAEETGTTKAAVWKTLSRARKMISKEFAGVWERLVRISGPEPYTSEEVAKQTRIHLHNLYRRPIDHEPEEGEGHSD
jgi:RNA polymerase sigma factor (sigma-70 family)